MLARALRGLELRARIGKTGRAASCTNLWFVAVVFAFKEGFLGILNTQWLCGCCNRGERVSSRGMGVNELWGPVSRPLLAFATLPVRTSVRLQSGERAWGGNKAFAPCWTVSLHCA